MEGPLWAVERRWYVEINHDGLFRLLLYLDMGATVFHFPCDPVWMTKGWMFESEACGLTAVQPRRSGLNLVGRGVGGGTERKELAQLFFWNNSPFGKKKKN